MEFSWQEYWSGLLFPSPGDLPNPGTNPGLLHCRQTLHHLSHPRTHLISSLFSSAACSPRPFEHFVQLSSYFRPECRGGLSDALRAGSRRFSSSLEPAAPSSSLFQHFNIKQLQSCRKAAGSGQRASVPPPAGDQSPVPGAVQVEGSSSASHLAASSLASAVTFHPRQPLGLSLTLRTMSFLKRRGRSCHRRTSVWVCPVFPRG